MTESLIFGYTWEEIKAAQQGKPFRRAIPPTDPNAPILHDGDLKMLAEFGLSGLKEKEFYGVIDRLTCAGVVPKE